jgi:hypothetical protein
VSAAAAAAADVFCHAPCSLQLPIPRRVPKSRYRLICGRSDACGKQKRINSSCVSTVKWVQTRSACCSMQLCSQWVGTASAQGAAGLLPVSCRTNRPWTAASTAASCCWCCCLSLSLLALLLVSLVLLLRCYCWSGSSCCCHERTRRVLNDRPSLRVAICLCQPKRCPW